MGSLHPHPSSANRSLSATSYHFPCALYHNHFFISLVATLIDPISYVLTWGGDTHRTGNQVEGFRRRRCALVEPITSNNIVGNLSVSPLLHFTFAKVSIIFRRRHSLINIGIKTVFYDHHQHKRQTVHWRSRGTRSWMVDVFWCHLENVALITFLFLCPRPLGRKVLLGISSLMNTAIPHPPNAKEW